LVPGDSFATRTLLPDDEIMKRLKPDEEDMAKALVAAAASINLSPLINKEGGDKPKPLSTNPVFSQNNSKHLSLYRASLTNLKTSALSVIADSNQVEVLILKPNILSFLPEHEKDKIYEDIVKNNAHHGDADKPSSISEIMRVKVENKKWEGYRMRLAKDIRKSQYMDRHKGVYKR
jgi:hypothetical protein